MGPHETLVAQVELLTNLDYGASWQSAEDLVTMPQASNETWPDGVQIDLLIDRADNAINVIEIKFSQGPFTITKSYAGELRRKIEVFRNVTGTRKNIFITFLTTHGVTRNAYATELVQASLTTDILFAANL